MVIALYEFVEHVQVRPRTQQYFEATAARELYVHILRPGTITNEQRFTAVSCRACLQRDIRLDAAGREGTH